MKIEHVKKLDIVKDNDIAERIIIGSKTIWFRISDSYWLCIIGSKTYEKGLILEKKELPDGFTTVCNISDAVRKEFGFINKKITLLKNVLWAIDNIIDEMLLDYKDELDKKGELLSSFRNILLLNVIKKYNTDVYANISIDYKVTTIKEYQSDSQIESNVILSLLDSIKISRGYSKDNMLSIGFIGVYNKITLHLPESFRFIIANTVEDIVLIED